MYSGLYMYEGTTKLSQSVLEMMALFLFRILFPRIGGNAPNEKLKKKKDKKVSHKMY